MFYELYSVLRNEIKSVCVGYKHLYTIFYMVRSTNKICQNLAGLFILKTLNLGTSADLHCFITQFYSILKLSFIHL